MAHQPGGAGCSFSYCWVWDSHLHHVPLQLGAPTIIDRIDNTIIIVVNYRKNIDKVKQTF